MEQYKIPREVQVEDRIFGPITMRRLIILSIGGGITYLIWLKLSKVYGIGVWGIPTFVFGSFTLAFAFLEPMGMRFGKFLLRLIEFLFHPKKLKWDNRFSQQVFFQFLTTKSNKQAFQDKKAGKDPFLLHQEKEEKLKHLHEITPLLDFDTHLHTP